MNENTKTILFLEPVFKQMIWGGDRLGTDFGYQIPGDNTGECWGISAHPHGDTRVSSGEYAGRTLSSLWEHNRELFGNLPEDRFPLLIKIIDAKADLSIQVHPDDAYAMQHEDGSFGKTECWYIIDCPAGARLVLGHNASDRQELTDMVRGGKWQELLRYVPIQKGDFIQIEPGTVHAITSGCLLLETQRSSDITYRVYDYDRLSGGKPRELHIEKSLDVINVPEKPAEAMVKHKRRFPKNKWEEMISCGFYRVFQAETQGSFVFEQKFPFLNVSVIDGAGSVNKIPIQKGDHFILPSGLGRVELTGELGLVASCAG